MQYIQQPSYGDTVASADPTANNQWVNNEPNNQTMASINTPLATADDLVGNVAPTASGDSSVNAAVPSSHNQKTSERMRLDEGMLTRFGFICHLSKRKQFWFSLCIFDSIVLFVVSIIRYKMILFESSDSVNTFC